MTNSPAAPAYCLDLSRLVSRVGRGAWTGIDRVEAAYLEAMLAQDVPVHALVRMRGGHAILDRGGMEALGARLHGRVPWGRADLRARLTPGLSGLQARVESDLRRLARGTCPRPLLTRLIGLHVPDGCTYLNVGHSNLTAQVFEAWARARRARIAVLVHDMIPLSHPRFQREGVPARFEAAMQLVGQAAHRVIYNSAATRAEAEAHFRSWGRVPEGLVAHLGVPAPQPDPAAVPAGLLPEAPYFVALGTIEPRKNHALLLDLWEAFHAEGRQGPHLLILGARGWANAEVFARLDRAPGLVQEAAGLPDGAVAAVLQGAAGLLHPSRAEGYGLPPMESLALGTPAICADLPVFREILGDRPVYADPDDRYAWRGGIEDLAAAGPARRVSPAPLPGWDEHFKLVLSMV